MLSAPTDPRVIVERSPMSPAQWLIVAIMCGLNALDGFDVLSISFASPGIAKAWGIDRAALGFVLSMELIGMALGSLALGGAADRFGRRNTILACLVVMGAGMLGASSAGDITTLSAWRIFTGLGIGGMLAAINAAVAEAANARQRSLAVVLMSAGYPIGTTLGGLVAAQLLKVYDWPAIFVFGAIVTFAFIPLVLAAAPESIAFVLEKRPPDALARVNRVLRFMGHPNVAALPPAEVVRREKLPLAGLFRPGLARPSILLALAYFLHVISFYFIIKWIPKIVVDFGYPPATAAGVLVWASLGGAVGALTFGLFTKRLPLGGLIAGTMFAGGVFVTLFGQGQPDLALLSVKAAAAGFFTNAAIVGMYAFVAQAFPTELRATATGFVIGLGRGGSALAPAVAGLLFKAGYGLSTVSLAMAAGTTLAGVTILILLLGAPRLAASGDAEAA